jgi:hypothetical protein
MKIKSSADIDSLFEEETARITQPDLLDLIARLRVPTRCEQRPWDYGEPNDAYPCWIVLEHPESNTCIAYCEEGFGPRDPWGLLFIRTYLGMGWTQAGSCRSKTRCAAAWRGKARPAGYEVQ